MELDQDVNYGTGTIRLILQFPEGSKDTAADAVLIQKEVRAILVNELQEQMKNLSSGYR